MRIEQVTASGFGPLRGQVLDLADGLTVVVGGNETGKSSWHAAVYAGLCGMRRGKGQAHERDREFRRRHRPWDGTPWCVSARLRLDDGRLIEMTHDLDTRVACRATDLGLGRDVSAQVHNDGAVDGSIWLGLGRRAFEATACVRQADLLAVRRAGSELSDLLGRVAASAQADDSTAAALARLADFSREQVGTDRQNSVRPWRLAIDARERAARAVDDARRARARFDVRAAEVDELRAAADAANRRVQRARAAQASAEADALHDRLARATGLAAELGPDRPASTTELTAAVAAVAAAVAGWQAVATASGAAAKPSTGRDRSSRRSIPAWVLAGVAAACALVALLAVAGSSTVVAAVGGALAVVSALAAIVVGARRGPGSGPADPPPASQALARAYADLVRSAAIAGVGAQAGAPPGPPASTQVGAPPDGPPGEELAVRLAAWLDAQRAQAQVQERTLTRWRELDRTLGDGDLAGLRRQADLARARADQYATEVADATADATADVTDVPKSGGRTAPAVVGAVVGADAIDDGIDDAIDNAIDDAIDDAARAAAALAQDAARAEGEIDEAASALVDVSALEEELAAADAELERVLALKDVLDRTTAFMAAAQDRVHRDLAPRLVASVVRWLPVVTGGRYVDATIDPQDLRVRVRSAGGQWSEADVLSYGTAEQVYLLLRLALVEYLTADHDSCPLLLDDVTVHADAERTQEILDLLLAVSAQRQVVLFSQEDQVARWAEAHGATVTTVSLGRVPQW